MIYLAYIEGPRGPMPYLLHREQETDHFVGVSDLVVVDGPHLVPDFVEPTISAAERWYRALRKDAA